MSTKDIFGILGAIVMVALITAVVSRPNSARVIRSIGNAFSDSIKAALGRG